MKSILQKEKKRRFLVYPFEKSKKIYKAFCINKSLTFLEKENFFLALTNFPKNSFLVRLKNRCFFTGRARFVLNSFHLSRLMFKALGRDGLIQGLRKSS